MAGGLPVFGICPTSRSECSLRLAVDAWAAFRVDVEKACRAALASQMPKAKIIVDPFGTESYGVAIARGVPKGGKTVREIVCVYDKKTQRPEVTGELPLR